MRVKGEPETDPANCARPIAVSHQAVKAGKPDAGAV